jgi:hypothetical protein
MLAKYEVICAGPQDQPTFWMGYGEKGGRLVPKGEIVELETDLVKVSVNSRALKPVGDAPVFDEKGKQVQKKPGG